MKVIFIGDIVGKPGRRAVTQILPALRKELGIDVAIANLENLAHGKGMTRTTYEEILAAGVDIGSGGNHTFSKPEAGALFRDPSLRLVRPANIPVEFPGEGMKTFTVSQKRVTMINLLGELGMPFPPVDSPFTAMQKILDQGLPVADATIVDIHAIFTSEKVAMGWYLDGKVSAVIGTDTHIPTADTRILPKGTGYQTDAGMVGLHDSSLGVDWHAPLEKFLSGAKAPWEIPEHGLVDFQAVLLEITEGRTRRIERISRQIEV